MLEEFYIHVETDKQLVSGSIGPDQPKDVTDKRGADTADDQTCLRLHARLAARSFMCAPGPGTPSHIGGNGSTQLRAGSCTGHRLARWMAETHAPHSAG